MTGEPANGYRQLFGTRWGALVRMIVGISIPFLIALSAFLYQRTRDNAELVGKSSAERQLLRSQIERAHEERQRYFERIIRLEIQVQVQDRLIEALRTDLTMSNKKLAEAVSQFEECLKP